MNRGETACRRLGAARDARARSAVLLDPLAADRDGSGGAARTARTAELRSVLQLDARRVARAADVRRRGRRRGGRRGRTPTSPPGRLPVDGVWSVSFVEGGPALPAAFETRTLASWTALGDDEARRFAGTARYTLRFERPRGARRRLAARPRRRARERARAPERAISRYTLEPAVPRAAGLRRCGRARTGSRSRSRTSRRTGSATSTVAASRGRGSTTSTW